MIDDIFSGAKTHSTPLPYTSNPINLLWNDIILFLRITLVWPISAGIPSIILPFWPLRSGPLCELYPSRQNIWTMFLHFVLVVVQLAFILSLVPSALIGVPIPFYTPIYIAYVVGFVIANEWVSVMLNGRRRKFQAGAEYMGLEEHKGEKWIFVNGVAVGDHWLQSNLERLAKTFRRPITAIHNQTRGIIFDVLECIIQRDFTFATTDIRDAYAEISTTLSDPSVTKLVLILHSQGAIEGGIVLDWLYATVPASQLSKLEVYTFGNAANHWNSPVIIPSLDDDVGISASNVPAAPEDRVVKYIEHYANTGDFVAKFGILHFRPSSTPHPDAETLSPITQLRQSTAQNRFVGRLFKREGSGHQMNGNYLDNMFQMDPEMNEVLENNDFMDSVVDEVLLEHCDMVEIKVLANEAEMTVEEKKKQKRVSREIRVKDLSRLWKYRNGLVPED